MKRSIISAGLRVCREANECELSSSSSPLCIFEAEFVSITDRVATCH